MESEDYNIFKNLLTGESVHALGSKRGNKVYSTRKTQKKKEILDAMEGKEFDYPVGNKGLYRKTRLLFVTVSFDRLQFSMEEAWAALRSTPIEGVEYTYNVMNKLNAQISKIFGTHGTLICKEAQESGYPAPHMILILDEPVLVKITKTKKGTSWRLCDPAILRRIGKSPDMIKLSFKDSRKYIKLNPVWKHGFIDFEGIVQGGSFRKCRNALSYPFKYLTKCLTEDNSSLIESHDTINEITDKGLKTTLFTHLGNKSFRTRDLSIGKGFKSRIGLLDTKKEKDDTPKTWTRILTIPDFIHYMFLEDQRKYELKKIKKLGGLKDVV